MEKEIKKLILEDYRLLKTLNIPVTQKAQDLWIADTIEGHARSGHSVFRKPFYPELTKEQIYLALGMNPDEKRLERENSIYEYRQTIQDLIEGKITRLVNRRGEPSFGALFLRDIQIDVCKESLKGLPLAGRMDSNYWRQKTVEDNSLTLNKKKLIIGSGKEFIVNTNKLDEFNLTKEKLSNETYSEKLIQFYNQIGLILNKIPRDKKGIENIFIRTSSGLGCCDDSSLISIGKIHHPDALLLGWGVDSVDTLTKFIKNPRTGGLDEWIGEEASRMWKEKYHEDLITPEETKKIIYLGSKNNFPKISMSSSHRRFDQIEKKQMNPTIINHYNFVKKGIIPKKYQLGFDRMSSNEFYDSMNQRFYLSGIMEEPKKEKIPRKIKDLIPKIPKIKIKKIKKEPVKEEEKYYKKK